MPEPRAALGYRLLCIVSAFNATSVVLCLFNVLSTDADVRIPLISSDLHLKPVYSACLRSYRFPP